MAASIFILYGLIGALLLRGCYTDVLIREVSNKITFAVILLSIPLILMNTQITVLHLLIIALLLITYAFLEGMGGADIKVLLPLILIFNIVQLLILFGSALIIGGGMFLKYRWDKIPFFIPITAGYILNVIMLGFLTFQIT